MPTPLEAIADVIRGCEALPGVLPEERAIVEAVRIGLRSAEPQEQPASWSSPETGAAGARSQRRLSRREVAIGNRQGVVGPPQRMM